MVIVFLKFCLWDVHASLSTVKIEFDIGIHGNTKKTAFLYKKKKKTTQNLTLKGTLNINNMKHDCFHNNLDDSFICF